LIQLKGYINILNSKESC